MIPVLAVDGRADPIDCLERIIQDGARRPLIMSNHPLPMVGLPLKGTTPPAIRSNRHGLDDAGRPPAIPAPCTGTRPVDTRMDRSGR
ncbi:MAG: hypothetical protein CMJ32_08590 [Phycisphaerae bacterium]|nr:hypothetical protein [Phycisphaerae bacterium]